jgi:hypothetical protein
VRVKVSADDVTEAENKALELYNQGNVIFPTTSVLEIVVVNPRGVLTIKDS